MFKPKTIKKRNVNTAENKPPRIKNEAIKVRTDSKTYIEALKEVKQINIINTGTKITNIRKTRGGDMLITLDSEKGRAEKLVSAIAEEFGKRNITTIGKRKKILHISDIDAITTKAEIEEAVAKVLNTTKEEITVSSVRPTYGENQNATVILDTDKAPKLIKVGRIPIGVIQCRVRERDTVKRCYRCQEFSHVIKACQQPSRENMCLRYGEEGHKAESYQKDEFCWVCKTKGHRGGTMKCPLYRKLLGDAVRNKHRNIQSTTD